MLRQTAVFASFLLKSHTMASHQMCGLWTLRGKLEATQRTLADQVRSILANAVLWLDDRGAGGRGVDRLARGYGFAPTRSRASQRKTNGVRLGDRRWS